MLNVKLSATRIKNDQNGNPRYHFPRAVWPLMNDKTRLSAGLKLYRGKRYGAGYVMTSYYLDGDIDHAFYAIQYNI